jgi:zona occludens toxin
MITLITGEPGNGKTALVVKMLTEVNDRPVFVMGIRDLQIPHEPVPPISEWTEHRPVPEDPSLTEAWFTFPPNALIVIDEAQKVYRPRASGSKVPDIVAAFETHRHTGVDFWLITQAPGLIDSNIRKLIAKHIHIRANFMGRRRYEWVGVGDPESKQSREIARSENYAPPKEVFGLYKSAEAHTKVRHKIPFYVYPVRRCPAGRRRRRLSRLSTHRRHARRNSTACPARSHCHTRHQRQPKPCRPPQYPAIPGDLEATHRGLRTHRTSL